MRRNQRSTNKARKKTSKKEKTPSTEKTPSKEKKTKKKTNVQRRRKDYQSLTVRANAMHILSRYRSGLAHSSPSKGKKVHLIEDLTELVVVSRKRQVIPVDPSEVIKHLLVVGTLTLTVK